MEFSTFSCHLNALVTEFLEAGGDPAECGDLLREIADEVFDEDSDEEEEEEEEEE
jgi:hypothetical protein